MEGGVTDSHSSGVLPAQMDTAADGVQLGTLSFGHAIVDSYGHTLLAPMFPLLAQRLGLGLDDIGTLPIMMGLTASMAQPIVGWLTDRYPRIPAVAMGPALAAIFMGLVGFANNYGAVAAMMFCAGVGIGAYHPQGASLARTAARGRGLAMSSFTVGGNIGFGVAPLLGAAYYKWFGLERFYFAAIPGLLFGVVMLGLLRRSQPASVDSSRRSETTDIERDYVALGLLTGTVTVRAAVQIAMSTFLAFLLRERGIMADSNAIDVAGVSLAVFLLAVAVSGPVGGQLCDRLGRRTVMIASLASAPFVFSFGLALPGVWLVGGIAAGGFVLMLPHPANVIMAQEYVPKRSGLAASMVTGLAWGLGQFLSWPIGALAERIGVEAALQSIIWLPLLGVLMTLPLRDARELDQSRSKSAV